MIVEREFLQGMVIMQDAVQGKAKDAGVCTGTLTGMGITLVAPAHGKWSLDSLPA
jgi:hypothetical protein